MKPFDLTKAQAGAPILLMLASEFDMTPVRLVGMLTDGRHVVERRAESGVYYVEVATEQRLRMAPQKRTMYVNIWRDERKELKCTSFDSEYVAKTCEGWLPWLKVAVPIEIEE